MPFLFYGYLFGIEQSCMEGYSLFYGIIRLMDEYMSYIWVQFPHEGITDGISIYALTMWNLTTIFRYSTIL